MSSPIDLTDRKSFAFWHEEQIRFSDTDMIGHLNNVAFAAIIESGRVAFARSGFIGVMPANLLMVMARIEIDYRAEVHYPAEIAVGSVLMRLGRSSLAIGNGVFTVDVCAATSITTMVFIDKATRRSCPIPADIRALLEAAM